MSMNFIEPEEQQTIPVSVILENLTVSPENKEWLLSLFLENEIPSEIQSDFEYSLGELVKKSDEKDSSSFRALFLFDYYGILSIISDCLDKNKLLSERIKIIPSLFTKTEEAKPSVFKSYIANILDNIKDCAEKDKKFSEVYQKKLQEIRASSSFEERAVHYVKLVFQNLPKRTYKKDEKLLTVEDINKNMSYSVRLIIELEEMPENSIINAISLPFFLCGKKLFPCIVNALSLRSLMHLPHKGSFDSLIEKIEIPQWDEKNYIHEIFFELAKELKNMSIIDKIFEGINAVNIPYIFFEYIKYHAGSIYRSLLKDGYSDIIEPVRAELESLDDWATTTDTNDPHKISFDKSRLFFNYIDKLSDSAPKDKLELFQVLFFQEAVNSRPSHKFWDIRENIKDILDSIAQERISGELTFPARQKEADVLYKEFVNVIAKGAAKYPLELFLSEKYWRNFLNNGTNEHELVVFKQYCELLELKKIEDTLLISEFWFNRFHDEKAVQRIHPPHEYFSELEKKEEFFYKNVFRKFIDDEDFICSFLSVPQNFSGGHFLAAYYLACWVLYQNKDENTSDVFNKASEKLSHGKKIIFSEKITEFIWSIKILDEISRNGNDNEGRHFLFKLSAALGGGQYHNILKNIHSAEEHFPLYHIRYNYSHEEFIGEEFLDFLFGLKNPSWMENEKEIYNLEIIQEACKENVLKKQLVLDKMSDYIHKNRKELFKSSKIKKLISYFFIETEENKTLDMQTVFFTLFCERAVQENEDSCTELYLFFGIRSYFPNKIDTILEKHTDTNNILVTRCCKMLNNLNKNIEQKKFPEDEHTFLNDYILPASDFVWEKTWNIWKALKPLILAFRASKDILLNESLDITPNILSYLFLKGITSFFMIEDQEKLKELRYDMANDFAEYLKPAKKERQAEKYTQIERETEGFALSYTEPSPYWRYAYIRALGDLGIKTDKRGHYFHEILKKVSEKDPSEKVKSVAKKVMEELDSIRKGYSGTNHKKCLFEAFWWLKNAHMLSLGGKVDDKKALELRIKEWR
jgi:hypothetical protein